MSTPSSGSSKPTTRSANKKGTSSTTNLGASPALQSRKRKSSINDPGEEPLAKKMADNQTILDAINGIKTSVTAMEKQLKEAPTKNDLTSLVSEIRGVRESVIRNTDRIDTLFDMRKDDGALLAKRVDKLVADKLSTGQLNLTATSNPNEKEYLLSRRSIRLWPVQESGDLEKGVKRFLAFYLKIPTEVIEGLCFQNIEKLVQSRRSKIQDEVLLRLRNSQQRDIIQSYASNLASVQGQAGIRLDIPDHLRGLFRLFEAHAAALRAEFGVVKRAIRFEDSDMSLYMDVKLTDTDWHRISANDVRMATAVKKKAVPSLSANGVESALEKKKILFMNEGTTYPEVESDAESSSRG